MTDAFDGESPSAGAAQPWQPAGHDVSGQWAPPAQPRYNTYLNQQWEPPAAAPGAPAQWASSAQTGGLPAYLDPSAEFIPLPVSKPPKRSKVKLLAGTAAVAVVLAVAGVGAYAFSVLNGGGTQPEEALPSNTIAFAKIDLNPAANQKIALYELSRKVPALSKTITSNSNVKDGALEQYLKSADLGIDYNTDVKPWLGDRAAVAAVPDDHSVYAVLALAVSDQNKMKVALARVAANTGRSFGYTNLKGYELISDTQAHADAAAAGARHSALSSNSTFKSDVASLPGDQIMVAWADVANAASVLPGGMTSPLVPTTGRFVVGLHATSSYLELAGSTFGGSFQPVPPATMLPKLPASTAAAVEVSGLGQRVASWWSLMPAAARASFAGDLNRYGIVAPSDFEAILGTDLTVSVGQGDAANPPVAAEVKTNQAQRAIRVLQNLVAGVGPVNVGSGKGNASTQNDVMVVPSSGGYLVTDNPAYAKTLETADGPSLDSTSLFTAAVPHASGAVALGYVNMQSVFADPQYAKERASLRHLAAIGFSVNQISDATSFDMRAVVS